MWIALFLVPFVMTPVVGGIAWRFFIWQQEFGVVNRIAGLFGAEARYWLLDRETALLATMITNSWHLIPLAVLVFYAALTTIPDELHDAGRVDGAKPLQALWYIVLPMLRPHILFVSIILITSAFREFDMIWALTGGGPGRATTVHQHLRLQPRHREPGHGHGQHHRVLDVRDHGGGGVGLHHALPPHRRRPGLSGA